MAFRMAGLTRTKAGSWFSRKAIPEDVRSEHHALFKQRWEVKFHAPASVLPAQAKVLFSQWQAEIDDRFATLRAKQRGEGRDLTQREARALAGEWYRWFVGQHEENPGQPDGWIYWQWAVTDELEAAVGSDPREIDWTAPEVRKEIRRIIADAAKTTQFLASRGEVLTAAAMDMFFDDVLGDFLVATGLLDRRARGDYSSDRHLQTLPEYRKPECPKAAPQSAVRSGKTAMKLFEDYILASDLAARTISHWRVVFTTLDKQLAGRDFDALSDDEAQQWVNTLVTKRRSASRVINWIKALKAVGKWAVKQRSIARNPFTDSSIRVPKKTRHRETKAFSTDEIKLILSRANAITHTREPGMAMRRWVPWICAYTGARAGEITQLRGKDVIEKGGINALFITPEAGSTKTRTPRTVPIHDHLVAQGFLDYVRSKGKGPLFYNPTNTETTATQNTDITHPKLPPAVHARSSLGRWIRSIGITDKEVSPTHGWRHTFKQIADRHGISDRVSDAITGHAPPTEGRAYGAPTLEDMAKALKLFPWYEAGPSGCEHDTSRAIDPNQLPRPQPTPAAPTNP
jgi:integrase